VRWCGPLLGGIELSDVLIRLLILGEIVKTERCKTGYGEKSLPRVKSVVPRANLGNAL
jgi:hypothetical protein